MEHTQKPEKQKITVVIPLATVKRLKIQAQLHQRSFAGELVWAVHQYLEQQEKKENR